MVKSFFQDSELFFGFIGAVSVRDEQLQVMRGPLAFIVAIQTELVTLRGNSFQALPNGGLEFL